MIRVIHAIFTVAQTLNLDAPIQSSVVDTKMLLSVCKVESNFQNIHVENDGTSTSWGACQVKAIAAREVGVNPKLLRENPEHYSPYVAALYLKNREAHCRKYWNNKKDIIKCTLKAYNSGVVVKSRESLENNPYSKKVLRYMNDGTK